MKQWDTTTLQCPPWKKSIAQQNEKSQAKKQNPVRMVPSSNKQEGQYVPYIKKNREDIFQLQLQQYF